MNYVSCVCAVQKILSQQYTSWSENNECSVCTFSSFSFASREEANESPS